MDIISNLIEEKKKKKKKESHRRRKRKKERRHKISTHRNTTSDLQTEPGSKVIAQTLRSGKTQQQMYVSYIVYSGPFCPLWSVRGRVGRGCRGVRGGWGQNVTGRPAVLLYQVNEDEQWTQHVGKAIPAS